MIKRMTMAGAAMLALAATGAQAQIVDGGFEAQGAASTSSFCYFGQAGCATSPWSGTGSGLQVETNAAWPGAPTTDGSYYAFIQNLSTLSQTFTAGGGVYNLSWLAAGRPAGCCDGNQQYTVSVTGVNGTQLLASDATTTGQGFAARSASPFTLAAGTYTLTFTGLSSGPDNTAFIDAVALAPVPEPATWGMMILGFGAVGGAVRWRRVAGRLATA